MPLLLVSLIVAMCFTIFLSPAIGVPLLVLAAIFGAAGWFNKNESGTARMEEFRENADSGVEFTERDRETLTPAESDPAR